MNTRKTVPLQVTDEQYAIEAELRRQRDALLEQVQELTGLVQQIAVVITNARLDAREGKQTVYDYERASRACALRI